LAWAGYEEHKYKGKRLASLHSIKFFILGFIPVLPALIVGFGLIVLMLWIQLNTLSILIGFELNAGIMINRVIKQKFTIDYDAGIKINEKNGK